MVDRSGLQVVFGHPEGLLDTPQLVIRTDDEVGGLADQVGRVSLPARKRASLDLQLAVHALGCPSQLDEPIPFHRCMSVDGTLGFGDLLVDPAQCSPRSVVAVLVVHDPIRDSAGLLLLLAGHGWVSTS